MDGKTRNIALSTEKKLEEIHVRGNLKEFSFNELNSGSRYSFLVIWNTGCPVSDQVCLSTYLTYKREFGHDSLNQFYLISINNNKILDRLQKSNFTDTCYYYSDPDTKILNYKAIHLLRKFDTDGSMIRKYHNDAGLINFFIIDSDNRILYFRDPFGFSSGDNDLSKELDFLKSLIFKGQRYETETKSKRY